MSFMKCSGAAGAGAVGRGRGRVAARGQQDFRGLPYFSIIALRPHVPGLQFEGNTISVEDTYLSRLTVPLLDHWFSMLRDWGASFKFPRNKVIARELLRLQKRNMRSCRDILRPRTCQCRGCTLLQQKSSSSCSTWDMVVQPWSRARLRLSRLKWCLRRVEEYNLDVEFGVGPPHAPLRLREI